MNHTLDTKRIIIFLAFAFGLAWLCALVIYLTGGLVDSPVLIPGTNFSLATVLLALGYMWAPALAHIITRLITREGWGDVYLRPKLKQGWVYWLAAWFVPAIATILGAVVYFVLFPKQYDPSLGRIKDLMAQSSQPLPFDPWMLVVIQTVSAMLISPLINSLFTFGEEFGWRAYLQPKLMPLGKRKMFLLMGVIWGVWHWPVIAMGHNYGFDYPGAPWTGLLMMVWFTLMTGTFLGWCTLRGGSVWPAVIGHAALNGIASLSMLFLQGKPNPLLGPLPVGLVGSIVWTLLALGIFVVSEDTIVELDAP